MKVLASILYNAAKNGERSVFVKNIPNKFPMHLRFGILPKVHQFLHTLPLQLEQQGQGRGNATAIMINNLCLCFIADKLDLNIIDLVRLSEPTRHKREGMMSVADFLQKIEDMPDFTPVGDPIFSPVFQHDGGTSI